MVDKSDLTPFAIAIQIKIGQNLKENWFKINFLMFFNYFNTLILKIILKK
jgi:hypothetical protein